MCSPFLQVKFDLDLALIRDKQNEYETAILYML